MNFSGCRAGLCLLAFILALVVPGARTARSETLYNGIELPDTWPPRIAYLPDSLPVPPYLANPPGVIRIDVGRQLFVDDFLIADTTMTRSYHRPVYYPGNPVIKPDKAWEMQGPDAPKSLSPTAMPFSGGVAVDPADGKFKLWYMGGYNRDLCLAVSEDGIHWTKPNLDIEPGTNKVIPNGATESNTVVLDQESADPARRYKCVVFNGGPDWSVEYRDSADGLHWSRAQWRSNRCGDRTTIFYNPFRKKWVFSLRDSTPRLGRVRRYWEVSDISSADAGRWPGGEGRGFSSSAPLWVSADMGLDMPRAELGVAPQLYNLDCVAYESLMLGAFSILRGDFDANSGNGRLVDADRPKCNEIRIGFSRDGFHWYRPDHTAFMGISEKRGDWNWGNVQSAGNLCLIVGDHMYFYCSGRAGKSYPECGSTDAGGSTGLAILRRDGFASMDAGPTTAGALTTRPMQFGGKHLFVNVDAPDGELRVEALDDKGKVIAPYVLEKCSPIRANSTLHRVTWKDAEDVSALAGQPVRFRFHLRNGHLYAFWVSPDASGASYGYVAGGGPGFTSNRDTVGQAAYAARREPWARIKAPTTIRAGANGQAQVQLDGTQSAGQTGAITRYEWFAGGLTIATGPTPTVDLPTGLHRITLTVTDDQGLKGYDAADLAVLPAVDPVPPREKLVMWLKADSIADLNDGGAVATWRDDSGNALDPYAENTTQRPVWRKSAANGSPAVTFDGVDDRLQTTYFRNLFFTFWRVTIFVVVRPATALTSGAVLSEDFASIYCSKDNGGQVSYVAAGQAPDSKLGSFSVRSETPGVIRPDRWSIISLVHSGPDEGQTRLFVDGSEAAKGAVPYHIMNVKYGHVGCGRLGKDYFNGDIAEILIYAEALADDAKRSVEKYLADKYKLEGVAARLATMPK